MARYYLMDATGPLPALVKLAEGAGRPTARRETKLVPADVSTGPKGLIVVAFATLNVVDSDLDVTLPGAFTPTEVPLSAWGHGSWEKGAAMLPAGRGRIAEEGNRAIFRGRCFMGTTAGREHYETLRELGPLAEFSYGYAVADSERGTFGGQYVRFLRKLIVHEVSMVLKGAGRGTGVVEMSSLSRTQAMLAAAAHDNERQLAELAGYVSSRKRIGSFDGKPVYAGTGGRK